MNWYSKSSEGDVEAAARLALEERNNRAPWRFFLKENEEKRVIYLDDEGFSFQEHTIQTGPKDWKQFTCIGANNGCPICNDLQAKSYLITLFTIIELGKRTDSRGEVHENEKKIHALKPDAAMSLLRKKARWGGLKGKQVLVGRKGKTDFSSGSDFELDLKDGKPLVYNLRSTDEKYSPFNYETIFKPKSADDLRRLLNIQPQMRFDAPASSFGTRGQASFGNPPASLETIDPSSIPQNVQDEDVPF